MPSPSSVRRSVIDVAGRLFALSEESVAPLNAVNLLVTEGVLPAQAESDPACARSSAIRSVVPGYAVSIADYVRDGEQQERGDEALKFLSRLEAAPRKWNGSLILVGIEFVVLLLVMMIYSMFVLPTFRATFDAFGVALPEYTRLTLGFLSPSSPFVWLAIAVLVVCLVWRFFPRALGPLIYPLDKLLLKMPGIGESIRRNNAEMISGWLGFASADAGARQNAVEAARAWFSGALLSRICARVLAQAGSGRDLAACLADSPGFDQKFRAVMSLPSLVEAQMALRARWRVEANRPHTRDRFTVAVIHVILGVIVAQMIIAMYLPIFKLAALS
jgi:type IV pilus assembly protein PilC